MKLNWWRLSGAVAFLGWFQDLIEQPGGSGVEASMADSMDPQRTKFGSALGFTFGAG